METWCVNLHLLDYHGGRRGGWSWFHDDMLPCLQAYQNDIRFCLSVLFDTPLPAGISFLQMISAVLMPGLRLWSSPHGNTPRSLEPQTPSSDISGRPETRLLFSETTPLKWKRHFNGQKSSQTSLSRRNVPWGSKIPSRLCVHPCFGLNPRSAFHWL